MSKVRAEIDIDAPVEEVFAFFDDVANAAVLVAGLISIDQVDPLKTGGRRVEYTVQNRRGEPVGSSSEHLEHDPPRRTVTKGVQAGVTTTSTRDFVATTSGSTRVIATVEWAVPIKFVANIVTAPLRGPLKRSLRASLSAAKAAIET
ncbi:MAG: SRPBCC family protein [Acidimicrobiia bacterium]|jgi:uncharacterized membrane protein